jgi:glycosyltransferase involved in cell wall biosynthesis
MTVTRTPTVLQVCTSDRAGGAEGVALAIHEGLRRRGVDAWLAVGRATGRREHVVEIEQGSGGWSRYWWRRSNALAAAGRPRRAALERAAVEPRSLLDAVTGREDFRYPGTWRLPDVTGAPPGVIHFHNLHGGYFDLRALPSLSAGARTVVTLHDAWLLSGHCAHSFGCERWVSGCGSCPDLSIYPAVARDRTHENWAVKKALYERSRLTVVTPSRWLMEKVERSILAAAVVEAAVVPNGVDLTLFSPGDRSAARAALGVPVEGIVILAVGNGFETNLWRDAVTLRAALEAGVPEVSTLVILGDERPAARWGNTEIVYAGRLDDPQAIVQWYRAADLLVHPSRADTFPTVVLEALACGLPVVATAIGGIPEQVHGLDHPTPTGALVTPRDATHLSEAVRHIAHDPELRARMGENARRDAVARFGFERQLDRYLELYGSAQC